MPFAGRHVEDPGRPSFLQTQVGNRQEIRHIEEVAHRIAAETLLPRLQALVEGRDRANGKTRPGDVGQAQRHHGHVAHHQERFTRRLGNAVAGKGAVGLSIGIGTVAGRP